MMRQAALPDIGDTPDRPPSAPSTNAQGAREGRQRIEVIARNGERIVIVIPSRIWRRLPIKLRRRFDDVDTMLRGREVTARLVPIERFEPLREAIDDALDRELAEGAADGAARERAARERHGAEPGVPAAVMRAEIEGVH